MSVCLCVCVFVCLCVCVCVCCCVVVVLLLCCFRGFFDTVSMPTTVSLIVARGTERLSLSPRQHTVKNCVPSKATKTPAQILNVQLKNLKMWTREFVFNAVAATSQIRQPCSRFQKISQTTINASAAAT